MCKQWHPDVTEKWKMVPPSWLWQLPLNDGVETLCVNSADGTAVDGLWPYSYKWGQTCV